MIGVIPARYASTRFPGKPLAIFDKKSLIRRTYTQAKKAKSLSDVIVATDDNRIFDHVLKFGKVELTFSACANGTERCAELARKLDFDDEDIVINIQGDEAFINPKQIDALVGAFADQDIEIATLIKELVALDEFSNPDIVKVVLNHKREAIYFSRAMIPFCRNSAFAPTYYKHVGVYGYRVSTLRRIAKLPPSLLETAEFLEQLRWIDYGIRINTVVTTHESMAIDRPADLRRKWNST